jgi:hypothetical protein
MFEEYRPMSEPSLFRHYQIVQDAEGNNVELIRSAEQVAVLAFDSERLEFVHCHVLLEALKNKEFFEHSCKPLQAGGHPLMASLIDFGEDDGNPFYITSNVDGETLRSYLHRQTELPLWLAAMVATRSLDAAIALSQAGDYLADQPLDSFRLVQTGSSALQVQVADFRLLENASKAKSRLIKSNFDRQEKFLRSFLKEQSGSGGPTLPDAQVSAVDFSELLGSSLSSGGPGLTAAMTELRDALVKMVPDHLAGEIPTALKPRALVAPLLATYQEVARGVVNLVRIQSQRLDMANPYSMRGTLTRTGRPVLVEQVPPLRLCGTRVLEACKAVQKLAKKRDSNALLTVPLVHETETLTCMAEEVAEGLALSEILRERGTLGVPEAYVVLAGVDAALSQLERATVVTRKIRLEDIYLPTGFGRDDPRTARLLTTKLNEWPSFTVMLRAHPTLASMSGRGANPAVLLPPALPGKSNIWHGGWLAALGKFLTTLAPGDTDPNRERETITKLFEDEIAKARDGSPANRSDLLARFARIIHHYDVVAPTPISLPPVQFTPPKITPRTTTPEPIPIATSSIAHAVALTSDNAVSPAPAESESIGFAELLFRGPSIGSSAAAPGGEWGKGASEDFDSGEVGGWGNEPADYSPWWLKASVFIGGSMVAGAILAYLSGHAVWQKHPPASRSAVQQVSENRS